MGVSIGEVNSAYPFDVIGKLCGNRFLLYSIVIKISYPHFSVGYDYIEGSHNKSLTIYCHCELY